MSKSAARPDDARRPRVWLRRWHRWLGVAAAIFVLLLSVTGIALNHGSELQLDRRYVSWPWLLDAYGIHAPEPSASFTDRGRRATLLGHRLYLDAREIAADVDTLAGLVVVDGIVVVASGAALLVLTPDGDLVQRIALGSDLPRPVRRIGRTGERVVLAGGGGRYRSDAEVTHFQPWSGSADADVAWSLETVVPSEELAGLQAQYLGRGLTLERMLTDVHSGRIATVAAPYIMDIIAVLLIVLSSTGLILWLRNGRRGNR